MSSELGHPLPPVLADGDGIGAPGFISYLDPRPLYQPLFTKRHSPAPGYPPWEHRAQFPYKTEKADQIGNGVRSFSNWSDWWCGVDRCPSTFDFRTSWVGVLTACDGGGGFDSQQLGEVARLVDFLSSYLSNMTLWFCDPWQVIEPP